MFLRDLLFTLPYWGSVLRYLCRRVWGSSAARRGDPPAEPWPSLCRWCPLPEDYAWFAPPIPWQWLQRSLQLLAVKKKKNRMWINLNNKITKYEWWLKHDWNGVLLICSGIKIQKNLSFIIPQIAIQLCSPLKWTLFSLYVFYHWTQLMWCKSAESTKGKIFYPEAIMKSAIEGISPGSLHLYETVGEHCSMAEAVCVCVCACCKQRTVWIFVFWNVEIIICELFV